MLALAGLLTVVLVLAGIISKKLSPMAALVVIPIITALFAGFSFEDTSKFAISGIQKLAPVVGMFIFAILFFGIIKDAGTLEPIIGGTLRLVGLRPSRIVLGTAVLAMIVHLDGSGAVTFLVTVPAMLPLFDRLGMDRRILACVIAMAAGTANMLPWGGPTLRAASALQIPVGDLYLPMIPAQAAGLAFVLLCAWYLGLREERRLGLGGGAAAPGGANETHRRDLPEEERALMRPGMFWVNCALVVAVLAAMIAELAQPVLCFMIGTIAALLLNYPSVAEQRRRIDSHAKAALMMATILLAAGVFTGIMSGTNMLSAMADYAAAHIPSENAKHMPIVLSLLSMPLSLLFDPDSFYFGILPVLSEAGGALGVDPINMGRAAIVGQMTTGFPISPLTPATFLLVGLCRIELGDHQRFTFGFLWATSIVMTVVAVLTGAITL
ncbi:CitMHS family transporter [Paenirhodobacter populi]|uniref:Citrate transporter n=1 Tax=Paenirhodobacter populi TaxID=2306993 RepID=A0A443JJ04_9RHOB|nr:citrate:proton symporter [Sinirhodobacter populi]RWR20500.1 citrate transporter [Sinirhodobacter populi]